MQNNFTERLVNENLSSDEDFIAPDHKRWQSY